MGIFTPDPTRGFHGHRAALVIAGAGIAATVALLVWGFAGTLPDGIRITGPYLGLAGALGVAVGGAELVSRYRDEPLAALGTSAAIAYMLMNAGVSLGVYGLLSRYADVVVPALSKDPLMRSVSAGLGGMAFLRVKLFTLTTVAGEEIGLGPEAVVSSFLQVADRSVDRLRAERRLALVTRETKDVADPALTLGFLQVSLAAFQNIGQEEKAKLVDAITDAANSPLPPRLTLQAVCYGLLNIAGERDFSQTMAQARAFATPQQR